MIKDDFIKLTIPQRMEELWAEGEFISQKVYYDNDISLFLMENFLVEVFFNRIYNEIVGVEVQENNQILFEYVKDLELSELLK
ncbi:hypothetical protein [Aurantibacillus circumpalustris]|uniref:hypothetical protein n=1 Tax=Aurantibacillus circumpalustris TaxID=3036359 RepID=UPI00295AACC0|nr:hypothetical protein [Aurantibacillus circumpalustris]